MLEKVTIKYDGRFQEFQADELDLNPDSATNAQILAAVEHRMDGADLSEFQVEIPDDHEDRSSTTVFNLRPSAPFGN